MKRYLEKTFPAAVLLFCMMASGPAAGQSGETPSTEQIVARSNRVAYYQGKDGRADVDMSIIDAHKQ